MKKINDGLSPFGDITNHSNDPYINIEGIIFHENWRYYPEWPEPPDNPEVPSLESSKEYY